jgi:serine phosphatase RsbU (regulator of sigma subunit)
VLSPRLRLDREAPLRVLLVEDDDGDALLVREFLEDTGETFDLLRASSVTEALEGPHAGIDCLLLDLGLPDAQGLDAVTRILEGAPGVAVVVLTGLFDAERGIQSVAAGAQDYLVKGQVDGDGLSRAIHYAAERRASDEARRRMQLAERRQRENERMARGLLPTPVVTDPRITITTRYRPGGPDAQLGGDFYDVIETPQGSLRAVIGDVCGHGPDEAALGVAMRIAWRSLVRAGLEPEEVIVALDDVLALERGERFVFTTICDVEVPKDRRSMTIRLCGHPPPLLVRPEVHWVVHEATNPPIGVLDASQPIAATTVELPDEWSMILLTDGIFEGRAGDDRLGMDGIEQIARTLHEEGFAYGDLLDRLITAAREAHGADLPDDVALVKLQVRPPT